MAKKVKGRDIELWEQWKQEHEQTGALNNQYWEPLVKQVAVPAARSFVSKFKGKTDVPESTIYSHALRKAQEGIVGWDPDHSSGASLYTFVHRAADNNSSRFIQSAQNPAERVPEHRGGQRRTEYMSAKERYEGEYNHVPTSEDLAKYIVGNDDYPALNKLINKKNAVDYMDRFEQDVIKGAPGTAEVLSSAVSNHIPQDDLAVGRVRYKLSGGTKKDQEMLSVMELKLQGVSGGEISRRLGISASKVSNLSNAVVRMIQEEQRRR